MEALLSLRYGLLTLRKGFVKASLRCCYCFVQASFRLHRGFVEAFSRRRRVLFRLLQAFLKICHGSLRLRLGFAMFIVYSSLFKRC